MTKYQCDRLELDQSSAKANGLLYKTSATTTHKNRCCERNYEAFNWYCKYSKTKTSICHIRSCKIAKRIRSGESPVCDNLFIMFGSFHIKLSFFSSLGKFIEGSGGPYIYSLWMWYCSNEIHEQVFERQDVQSMQKEKHDFSSSDGRVTFWKIFKWKLLWW